MLLLLHGWTGNFTSLAAIFRLFTIPLVSFVERNSIVEGGDTQSAQLVCCNACFKHHRHFRADILIQIREKKINLS